MNKVPAEFYVLMIKRTDGQVYADLSKTDGHIYHSRQAAEQRLLETESEPWWQIVKLRAYLVEDEDETISIDSFG